MRLCQRGVKLDSKAVESRLNKSPIPFGARWGWAFLAGLMVIIVVFDAISGASRSSSRDAYLAAPSLARAL